jgi:hypothetical protein
MREIASVIIEQTIPATAIPVGAPTDFDLFIATTPSIRPIIAVTIPANGSIRETMPNTSEAIAIPLPGSFTTALNGC